jgi:hypothetical protein
LQCRSPSMERYRQCMKANRSDCRFFLVFGGFGLPQGGQAPPAAPASTPQKPHGRGRHWDSPTCRSYPVKSVRVRDMGTLSHFAAHAAVTTAQYFQQELSFASRISRLHNFPGYLGRDLGG